jgi:Mrp family chromosome partitioning ATPase
MFTLSQTTALETIYACIQRQNLKQFALCSPQKQSGNSQLALAIAIRAARSGKRVLLIEFNPQSAGLSRQLEISRNEWLPLTGHWEHAAQETRYPGLLVKSMLEEI